MFLGRRFLGSDERGGAGLTVVLGLSAFVIFGIAVLVGEQQASVAWASARERHPTVWGMIAA